MGKRAERTSTSSTASTTSVSNMSPEQKEAYYTKMLTGVGDRVPEKARPYFIKAIPYLVKLTVLIIALMPHIIAGIQKIDAVIQVMPMVLVRLIFGIGLCFFGGVFPLTVAAVEAWKQCGGNEAIESLSVLRTEFETVRAALDKDDQKDEDNDGVPDVLQISEKELMQRKLKVALTVIKPETISTQMSCLYMSWVGVIATLKLKFAKTVALGAALGEKLYGLAEKFVEPSLCQITPEEFSKWVPWGVRMSCKALAIWVAWWVQRILSAFHSAVRGGDMAGKALVQYANEKGWYTTSAEDSYADEIAGIALACLGVFVQFFFGFGMPFPLNLLTWPVSVLEGVLAWSVAS